MSIENELVHMTIKDLLSLIDNPSDTFQKERRWLHENTSIGNWGHILPLSIANQVLSRDPQGQVMRVLMYTPKIFGVQTTIMVGITPFSLRESGELRRMAMEKMAPLHSAKSQRNADIEACAQIVDGFRKRLKVPKGISDALISLAENMAKQCNYDPTKFQVSLDKLLAGTE